MNTVNSRVNLVAPPTLVAMALVMAAGAVPQTSPTPARHTRTDRQQVAELIAAVQQAAKVLHDKSISQMAADIGAPTVAGNLPGDVVARLYRHNASRLIVAAPFHPHLIDLPPPALTTL